MRHTLHSHILHLENTVQSLRDRLTSTRLGGDERANLEMQLAAAELALVRYREAYALELSLSDTTPPDRPAGTSDGVESQEGSRSKRKKEGLALAARTRKSLRARLEPNVSAFSNRASARA